MGASGLADLMRFLSGSQHACVPTLVVIPEDYCSTSFPSSLYILQCYTSVLGCGRSLQRQPDMNLGCVGVFVCVCVCVLVESTGVCGLCVHAQTHSCTLHTHQLVQFVMLHSCDCKEASSRRRILTSR